MNTFLVKTVYKTWKEYEEMTKGCISRIRKMIPKIKSEG